MIAIDGQFTDTSTHVDEYTSDSSSDSTYDITAAYCVLVGSEDAWERLNRALKDAEKALKKVADDVEDEPEPVDIVFPAIVSDDLPAKLKRRKRYCLPFFASGFV